MVTGDAGPNERHQSQLFLKCLSCGEIKKVKLGLFNVGHVGKCDCQVTGKYIGQTINNYRVLELVTDDNLKIKNRPTMELECIYCGKKKYIERYELNKQNFRPCNCIKSETTKIVPKSHISKLRSTKDSITDIQLNNFVSSQNYKGKIAYVGLADKNNSDKVWCKCTKCNKYDLVNKNSMRLVKCDCDAYTDELIEAKHFKNMIYYTPFLPYIYWSDDLIGQVIRTDKILKKESNALFLKVECIHCGKIRNVNGFELLRDIRSRTYSFRKCDCQLTKEDLNNMRNNYKDCRFGRLTVKSVSGDEYTVVCDCGKVVKVNKTLLLSGRKRSCGDKACNEIQNKYGDYRYLNKTFNDLKVLGFYYTNTHQKVFWECECLKCGSKRILGAELVASKRLRDCGCTSTKYFLDYNIGDYVDNLEILDIFSYKGKAYWSVQCPYCENKFVRDAASLVDLNAKSCGCMSSSSGEIKISILLNELMKYRTDISYKREQTFSDLVANGKRLRFDFAIYQFGNLIALIEFDGEQHYDPNKQIRMRENTEETFKKIQYYDSIKNNYCKDNNIPLLRIRYTTDTSSINEQVIKFLNEVIV